ncbi:hypothetical protein NW768_008421 [Fusarium equiseti]|uniref:Uncharacterized protein n=1 Tax=Fusarium equiseti TaxID=61235 RepID=A0ABQ8R723_FUSEQ|nr:hypothetical protein NW768_008421 [Fusarium equiseti]
MANSHDQQFHHSYLVDNSSSSSLRAPGRDNDAKGMNSPETRFLGHESTMPKDGLHGGNNTKRHFMPGTLFADFSLTLLPAAALGFAVAVMCLDKKTVEKEVLAKWDNAITVIASIFPILFASVASRMVFQAARWNLEKGATLNLLEQLIGSRTVGSTLVTQISLGRFNFLGVALLILWSLSPLGSQSALRMLRTRLEPIHANSNVLYYNTDAPSVFRSASLISGGAIGHYRSTQGFVQTMYSALLLAPPSSKSNAMDLWGNVKIPKLEAGSDDKGWKNISWNLEPDSYSSLIGLPITNVTRGNTTFSLESSYIDLDCKVDYDIPVRDTIWYEWDSYMGGTNNGSIRLRNGTWHGLNSTYLQTVWSVGIDRFVDEYWNFNERCPSVGETKNCQRPSLLINETDLDVRPAQLIFESAFQTSLHQYVPTMRVQAICTIFQRYVESRVACSRDDSSSLQNCTVTQQRFSKKPHADERVTALSFPDIWSWVTRGLPEGVKPQTFADNTIRYLNDPGIRSFAAGEGEEEQNILRNITNDQFGRRMSQLVNTYLLLGQLNQYASQGNSDQIANFAPNVTVPVDVSNLEEIYVVHWNWMALFFACCGVLLGSGVVGVVFAHLAAGPEILGYASSAVRDSKYLGLPADVGQKEALDVTKMIGQQKFKYGYTNAVSEEGRPLMGIALEDQVQGIKSRYSGKGSMW